MDKKAITMLFANLQSLWPYLAGLWMLGLIFQFLMIANRKPGIKVFDQRLMYNPFNLQFYGAEYLTLTGLKWRNLSWICYGVFVLVLIGLFGVYYYQKSSGA
ncbi:MAG: hypothetical protein M0042_01735 [Nitrospiraceae bacterium]|nr:hypothetical protein [Nitrospiraceae bacterium]